MSTGGVVITGGSATGGTATATFTTMNIDSTTTLFSIVIDKISIFYEEVKRNHNFPPEFDEAAQSLPRIHDTILEIQTLSQLRWIDDFDFSAISSTLDTCIRSAAMSSAILEKINEWPPSAWDGGRYYQVLHKLNSDGFDKLIYKLSDDLFSLKIGMERAHKGECVYSFFQTWLR
jgi:hypothetical protein